MTDGPDLDSRDPVDVREAYVQGMRASVTMLRRISTRARFEVRGVGDFPEMLDTVLDIADEKIEKWAQEHCLP
jgi:hypothetical protein